MPQLMTQEHLDTLKQEYEFISKSLGYMNENFNYFIRQFGASDIVAETQKSLTVEKAKLTVKIEFLEDFLKG